MSVDNWLRNPAAVRPGWADVGLAFASDAARATDCQTFFTIEPSEAGLSYFGAVCNGSAPMTPSPCSISSPPH